MGLVSRFTAGDWRLYSGAEKFDNGGAPFILDEELDGGSVTVIVDRNAVEIGIYADEDDEPLIYRRQFAHPAREIQAKVEIWALSSLLKEPNNWRLSDFVYELMHPSDKRLEGFVQVF
jgi:hypothetical protein